MAGPFNPLAIVETVARNIVPVAGTLFFGSQATSVLALYAGTSILIDIAPDRFLRAMPVGAEDADPLPGETRQASAGPHDGGRFRRNRKH